MRLAKVIFSDSSGGIGRLALAVTDEDQTDGSRRFLERLSARPELDVELMSSDHAMASVRRGLSGAAVILAKGFGEASSRVFYGAPPSVELWTDPSRKAESGLLEGLLFQEASRSMQQFFSSRATSRKMLEGARRGLHMAQDLP